MKKLFALVLILFLSCTFAFSAKKTLSSKWNGSYLMSHPKYRVLTLERTKAINVMRYTEAGLEQKMTEDREDISKLYDFLNRIVLGDETGYSCTDNTTIYVFLLDDGSKIPIEFECNWLVIDRKNYLFQVQSVRSQGQRRK